MNDPFWFWKLSFSFIIFVTIGFFGIHFYNKYEIKRKVKREMLITCSTNSNCQNAVSTYFQKCFDSNYDGYNSGPGLYNNIDRQGFAECMNKSAGVDYFKPIKLNKL